MKAIGYISLAAVMFCLGFLLGMNGPLARNAPVTTTVRDTLFIRDTVIQERPVPVLTLNTGTIPVAVRDTVVIHDTVFTVLPIEQKIYQDSTYRAVISGYKPSLESISVYPTTRYITETKTICVTPRKRWGIGIQAGYGVHLHGGQVYPAPYAGIGISYNLIGF